MGLHNWLRESGLQNKGISHELLSKVGILPFFRTIDELFIDDTNSNVFRLQYVLRHYREMLLRISILAIDCGILLCNWIARQCTDCYEIA